MFFVGRWGSGLSCCVAEDWSFCLVSKNRGDGTADCSMVVTAVTPPKKKTHAMMGFFEGRCLCWSWIFGGQNFARNRWSKSAIDATTMVCLWQFLELNFRVFSFVVFGKVLCFSYVPPIRSSLISKIDNRIKEPKQAILSFLALYAG